MYNYNDNIKLLGGTKYMVENIWEQLEQVFCNKLNYSYCKVDIINIVNYYRYKIGLDNIEDRIDNPINRENLELDRIVSNVLEIDEVKSFLKNKLEESRKKSKIKEDIPEFEQYMNISSILSKIIDLDKDEVREILPYLIFCFFTNMNYKTIKVCDSIFNPNETNKNRKVNCDALKNKFIYGSRYSSDRIDIENLKNNIDNKTLKNDLNKLNMFIAILKVFADNNYNFNIFRCIMLFYCKSGLFALILNENVYYALTDMENDWNLDNLFNKEEKIKAKAGGNDYYEYIEKEGIPEDEIDLREIIGNMADPKYEDLCDDEPTPEEVKMFTDISLDNTNKIDSIFKCMGDTEYFVKFIYIKYDEENNDRGNYYEENDDDEDSYVNYEEIIEKLDTSDEEFNGLVKDFFDKYNIFDELFLTIIKNYSDKEKKMVMERYKKLAKK